LLTAVNVYKDYFNVEKFSVLFIYIFISAAVTNNKYKNEYKHGKILKKLCFKQVKLGLTNDTREELRRMQTELHELRSENNALKIKITDQEISSNM